MDTLAVLSLERVDSALRSGLRMLVDAVLKRTFLDIFPTQGQAKPIDVGV
jgi:hypothetical protein